MVVRRLLPYGVAVGVSAAAWLLSLLLEPWIEPSGFPLFLGAVMASAWYGGLGPGLLATVLGALAGTGVMFPGVLSSSSASMASLVRLGVFALEGLVISSLAAALRAAQRRAEALVASEHTARREVEATAQRVRNLQSVSDTALASLHLADLLPELLGRVREILAADTVVILLLAEDGRELLVRASVGLEQEVAEGMRIPVGKGIAGQIAARRAPMVVEDLSRVEIWSPILRDRGLRSLLGAPLIVEGRLIGVVHVGTFTDRRFTEHETWLLQLAADRIATAIDHAYLYEAEAQARAAAETAERRFRLLIDGVRDYATYLIDPDGRVINWNAGAQRLKGYPENAILGRHVSEFYSAEDVRRGAPARALERAAAEGYHEEETWRVRQDGSRFWADVAVTALRDDEGRLVGFSVLTHDLSERRRAAEVRTRLLERVIAAQEEEQRRLARELHDETGQSLTSLSVGLRALEEASSLAAARARATELRRIATRALDEVRRLAWGLRPRALDELGLVAALEHHAAEYGQSRGLAVDVRARGLESGRVPVPVETALYRIVQEALTNAAKHAQAKTVSIVIQRQPAWVQAIVTDDGCGFDADAALRAPDGWTHLGLHGMRERAALVGGSVTIESTPGEGTAVYARIPLPHDAPHGQDPDPRRG